MQVNKVLKMLQLIETLELLKEKKTPNAKKDERKYRLT